MEQRVYRHRHHSEFASLEEFWTYDRAYNRELYLRRKAKKEEQIKALALQVADLPADVLAAIELDSRRYREMRIGAALRKMGEAKLEAEKN